MHALWLIPLLAMAASAQDSETPGSLTGRVVDANTGEPAPNVKLTLTRATPAGTLLHERPQPREAATGVGGRFEFPDLPPGRYYLRASKPGYHSHFYSPRPRSLRAAPFKVTPGPEATRIEMRLLPQAVVSGRILDEQREPVERAAVCLYQWIYDFLGRRTLYVGPNMSTSDTGEFRFADLSPGRYYLWVRHPGELMVQGVSLARGADDEVELDYAPVFYPGSPDHEGALPFDLEPGSEVTGLDVRLRRSPVFRVRGRVAGHDAPGVPQYLRLTPQGPDAYRHVTSKSAKVGPDGAFEFAGVPPGDYEIVASPGEGIRSANWSTAVHVRKQNVEDLVVAEAPIELATVQCELLVEGEDPEAPLHGALALSLRPVEGPPWHQAHGHSESKRTFTVQRVRPGRFWVNVSGRPRQQTWLKSILLDGEDVGHRDFAIHPGSSPRLTLVFAPDPGEISGLVVDGDGEPAPGAVVTLVPERPNPMRQDLYPSTAAEASGRFTMRDLVPGHYRIYAWEEIPPRAHFDPEYMKLHGSRAVSIEVQPGGRHEVRLREIAAGGR